jgi:hypothetical protein
MAPNLQALPPLRQPTVSLRVLDKAENREHEQPSVQTLIAVNFGHIERAAAKSAVNFLCKVAGPVVARGPAFESIRTFASLPNLEGPSKFVEWLDHSKKGDAGFLSTFAVEGCHTLLLLNAEHWPCVFMILYGRPFMQIRLTQVPMPGVLPWNTMVLAVFDYREKTHDVVSMAADPIGFGQRFSLFPGRDGGSHGLRQRKRAE